MASHYLKHLWSYSVLDSNQSPVCRKRILAHSGHIRCTICLCEHHLKCITLSHIEQECLLTDGDLIFHLFEFNDNDHRSPLCEIDPDLYFYNSTSFTDATQCNYFDEMTFNETDQIKNGRTDGALSMCHLNIRSIRENLSIFKSTGS